MNLAVFLIRLLFETLLIRITSSQVALVVKNPPANAGNIRNAGSIPGLGRSPEEGMATQPSTLPWRIPRTEEPGRLQSLGSQRVIHN